MSDETTVTNWRTRGAKVLAWIDSWPAWAKGMAAGFLLGITLPTVVRWVF